MRDLIFVYDQIFMLIRLLFHVYLIIITLYVVVRVNLDLRSSQRWLGLAHGLGTWFVVAHGIACD